MSFIRSYLDHEHDDEDKDEGGVEVADVEGGAESADQSVAADDGGQEHGGQFRGEAVDQGVEDGGAGDGQGHHHDQVGEEGEAAEHQVSGTTEAGFDHLVVNDDEHCV